MAANLQPSPGYEGRHPILRDKFIIGELSGCAFRACKFVKAGFEPGSDADLTGLTYYAKTVEELRKLTRDHPRGPWKKCRVKGQILQKAPTELYGGNVYLGCFTGKIDGLSVLSNARGPATDLAVGRNRIVVQYQLEFGSVIKEVDNALTYYLVTPPPVLNVGGLEQEHLECYLILPTAGRQLSREEAIQKGKPYVLDCDLVFPLGGGGNEGAVKTDLTPTGDSPVVTPKKNG